MPHSGFIRYRLTWLAYALVGYFGFVQAALGPLIPFLRTERGFSFTISSLHISAYALGWVLTGLVGDPLIRQYGRQRLVRLAGVGIAAGMVLLVFGTHAELTIAGALLIGFMNTLVVVISQALLADLHDEHRTVAITEANALSSICSIVSPLCLGLLAQTVLGWRGVLYVAILGYLLVMFSFRRTPMLASRSAEMTAGDPSAAFPASFWAYAAVLFLGVAVEWCVAFWGADYLVGSVGLTKPGAATAMSTFYGAMLLGRIMSSQLARSIASTTLLYIALGITLAGFPVFWLAPSVAFSIAGLCLTGVGVANLFPLTVGIATTIVANRADTAMARIALIVGCASLSIPLTLGLIAERVGLAKAYGMVIVLVVLALLAAGLASHMQGQISRRQAAE